MRPVLIIPHLNTLHGVGTCGMNQIPHVGVLHTYHVFGTLDLWISTCRGSLVGCCQTTNSEQNANTAQPGFHSPSIAPPKPLSACSACNQHVPRLCHVQSAT